MKRILYVCPAALVLPARPQLEAQSLQAQLEVNLGPIALDYYDGVSQNSSGLVASGPNVPACSYGAGSNYRACMQTVLQGYNQQGVVGVKIYFSLNGNGYVGVDPDRPPG
jgi:hypothetical protein